MQNTAHIVFFINLDAIFRGIAGNKMIVFIIIIKFIGTIIRFLCLKYIITIYCK